MPESPNKSAAIEQSELRLAFFVKFYKEKKHADNLLQDGLLYARRLKSFREEDDPQRGDRDEVAVLQAASQVYVLKDDGRKLPIKAVGPLQSTYQILDDLNLHDPLHFFTVLPRPHTSPSRRGTQPKSTILCQNARRWESTP